MSAGKRIGRFAFGRRCSFLSRKVLRVVPYATEELERRIVLSPLYDSPQPYVPDPNAVEASVDEVLPHAGFEDRLRTHILSQADMDEQRIVDLPWRGHPTYVRRNQWIIESRAFTEDSPARETLDHLGLGAIFVETLGVPTTALVQVPEGTGYGELSAALQDRRIVATVEPNAMIWTLATPNDTDYAAQQWSLNNTGQTHVVPGTVDADIDAAEAWDTTGTDTVVVAVIDSGVDYNHADLSDNIWTTTADPVGDIPGGNGADDDSNGKVDDWRGWDFIGTRTTTRWTSPDTARTSRGPSAQKRTTAPASPGLPGT